VQIDAGSVVNENLSSVVCLSFFFIIVVSDKRGAVGAQVGGAARVAWVGFGFVTKLSSCLNNSAACFIKPNEARSRL